MAKPIPVDGYIRVSDIGDRAGDSFISPELQRESIERVCKKEGLQVQEWVQELDASARHGKNRPGWDYLIERVEQGQSKGIVCWNLSRFSRSTKDALAALERVEGSGGKLYSEEGQLDKLSRTIRFAISEDESDRAAAGFRNAKLHAIQRGIYISAHIPLGYVRNEDRKLEVDPQTSPIVVGLFVGRSKGMSWTELSRWALSEWDTYLARETIRAMIDNPAYLGHSRHGDMVNEKAHEPLVSLLVWDQAHKAKGKRPVRTGASQSLLLRGLVTCSTCGHRMVIANTLGRKRKDGTREQISSYKCRNLGCDDHSYIKADVLDQYVVHSLMGILSDATMKQGEEVDLSAAQKELTDAQYALDQFKSNKKAITILGLDEWNSLLSDYVTTRDNAQMEVDLLTQGNPEVSYNDVPELWEEWTTESRIEFLHKIIGECVVSPAHRKQLPVDERVDLSLKIGNVPMNVEIRSSQLPEGWEMQFETE